MLQHIPPAAFAVFTIRLVIFGASIGDALALMALVGLYGFLTYLEKNKQPVVTEQLAEEVRLLKSSVEGLKLGNTFRGR